MARYNDKVGSVPGGLGGGGNGSGRTTKPFRGTNGEANTGGGGGGAGGHSSNNFAPGGNGGSGVVIIRCPRIPNGLTILFY